MSPVKRAPKDHKKKPAAASAAKTKPAKIEKPAKPTTSKVKIKAPEKIKVKKIETAAQSKVIDQPSKTSVVKKVVSEVKTKPISTAAESVPQVLHRAAPPVKPAVTAAAETKPSSPKPVAVQVAAPVQKKTAPIQTPTMTTVAQKEEAPRAAQAVLRVSMPITVGALAETMKLKVADLIKSLIGFGIFANINQLLNEEIVRKVAHHYSVLLEKIPDEVEKIISKTTAVDAAKLKFRPPVVTMMGHVDHGKTSLLDAIRKSNVAGGEAGQITQHIGAYVVEIPNKGRVTFLDTPGHEAFTAIRARGANVTDVVVLVVAADDGIKPQTVEAIDHARAAGCPIVVAINKCDLPTANFQRVMTQLQKHDLVPEEWGGKTICVKVSAKTGDGIDQLLDMLLLESEVLELKADPECAAQGTILEAKLTKGHGAVSTAIVQQGTLRVGDTVVAGQHYGKIRAMRSDLGRNIKEAGPSFAVEIHGLSGVPDAGQLFQVINDEKLARRLAEKRELELREREMKGVHSRHLSLQELYSKMKEGQIKELRLIVKADAQGSVEALTQSLERTVSDKIAVRIIHGGVGGINESDVMLAVASDAVLIGFHVKAEPRASELIEKEGIDARFYSIVYHVVEDIQKAMEGLLEPTFKEVIEGRAEIRKVYRSSKTGAIAGAMVVKGKIVRAHPIRLIRDNIVVFEGKMESLKRFKDDAREVQEGYECGIVLQGYQGIQERDLVECYRLDKVAGKLDS